MNKVYNERKELAQKYSKKKIEIIKNTTKDIEGIMLETLLMNNPIKDYIERINKKNIDSKFKSSHIKFAMKEHKMMLEKMGFDIEENNFGFPNINFPTDTKF